MDKAKPFLGLDDRSRMSREAHVRFCESVGVRLPHATRLFVERLWRSVKYEEVYLKAYQTVLEARAGINAYLEFYNRQRPHQALGYRTTAEVYQNGQEEKAAAPEVGLPSGVVKPSVWVGDSLNLALGLS